MKTKTFKPPFLLKNTHFQTIYPALFSKFKNLEIEVEKFKLSDKDFVECVWHNKPTKNSKKPIVTLFHGLAGGFNSPYIQRAMSTLGANGFSIVLMHFRGCGKEMNSLPKSYHSGETEDAKEWFKSLQKRYPSTPLFAIGYSLGGNMLLKLLGEVGNDSPLKACISISAPMQLEISADKMNHGFSKLYQYHLMKNLKRDLLIKYKMHDMQSLIGISENDVKNLKTFWEFDEAYTAPIHGFKSAYDYYKKSSSKQFLKNIKTNTLIIHAVDDPFMTPKILPNKSELSTSIKLEVYPNGGHVGFVAGSVFKPKYWLEERIVNYFRYTSPNLTKGTTINVI
jgi:predicted alpha/beta-fold hydrolase